MTGARDEQDYRCVVKLRNPRSLRRELRRIGNLWRHPLFEVPTNYGSSIRRFRRVTREVVVSAFLRFAREEIGDAKVDRSIQKTGFLRPARPG